jgi:hypothetical protein
MNGWYRDHYVEIGVAVNSVGAQDLSTRASFCPNRLISSLDAFQCSYLHGVELVSDEMALRQNPLSGRMMNESIGV